MGLKRSLMAIVLGLFAAGGLLAGCHVDGHVPPGQVKKIVEPPPPGHGGIPPGQQKKY